MKSTEQEHAEWKRKREAGEISELDYWINVTHDEGEAFASQSYRSELAKWLKAKHQKEINETWIPLVNDLRAQLEAARRAQVVRVEQSAIMPKGESEAAKLRAMATNYPAGHSWDKLDAKACIRGALEIEALRAMLAAAPQPPEADSNSHEFDGIKPEAAPVQPPEPAVPFAIFDRHGFYEARATQEAAQSFCNHYNHRDTKLGGLSEPYTVQSLYTEQQFRDLLAAQQNT